MPAQPLSPIHSTLQLFHIQLFVHKKLRISTAQLSESTAFTNFVNLLFFPVVYTVTAMHNIAQTAAAAVLVSCLTHNTHKII